MTAFDKQVGIWSKRRQQMGDGAVGRRGEDAVEQAKRTQSWLDKWLPGKRCYEHGLDFGCGWGRFTPALALQCGHLWAVDVFSDWAERAAADSINVTPVCLSSAVLPLADESMELVVDLQTLQSLDDSLLIAYSKELSRVAAPGATVISMHEASDEVIRTIEHRAKLLGLDDDYDVIETDAINDAKELYAFLVGTRA
jgi:hypothetical protein